MYFGFSLSSAERLPVGIIKLNSNNQKTLYFPPPQPPQNTKGSFSIDDGDGSENVTFKRN